LASSWHCFVDAAFSGKFAFPVCEHAVRRDWQVPVLQASLTEHEFLYIKSVLRKNQQRGQDDCSNEKRQPMKISVNSLTGQQRLTGCCSGTTTPSHSSKTAVKYQQKSHEHYLMDNHDQEVHVTRGTHDRKCMW